MSSVVYRLLWVLARLVARLCFGYRATGSERIPCEGGILIAANHASYLDIPMLGVGIRRRVWFLGRADLFPIPVLNGILQVLGWIPLKQGRLDRDAFGKAVGLIGDGKAVAIFPEGGRTLNGRLHQGKPGIGVIVSQAQCPVVPVFISGTYEALPIRARWPRFHKVEVIYGKPLDFTVAAGQYRGKAFYHHVSRTVMNTIAELGQVAAPTRQPQSQERGDRQSPTAESYNAE